MGAEPPQASSALDREEGRVLKEGDKTPAVTGASYDGTTIDLGAPGRRTVLFFYPKANTGG
jgi:peroxiredoxin